MPAQGSQTPLVTDSIHAAHGVAGLIVASLALIFLLHFLGFRFVVAAGVGR